MRKATVTEDHKLVIPEDVFEKSGLDVGESYEIVRHDNGVFFIPLPKMSKLAGTLKPSDTNIEREGHCHDGNCEFRI